MKALVLQALQVLFYAQFRYVLGQTLGLENVLFLMKIL